MTICKKCKTVKKVFSDINTNTLFKGIFKDPLESTLFSAHTIFFSYSERTLLCVTSQELLQKQSSFDKIE